MSDLLKSLQSIPFPQMSQKFDLAMKTFQTDLRRYMESVISKFTEDAISDEANLPDANTLQTLIESIIAEQEITNTTNNVVNEIADNETWFNVKDYGAAGDGVTNDYNAWQNCIYAAQLSGVRGHIIAKPGTYIIDTGLLISNPVFVDCPGVILTQSDNANVATILTVTLSSYEDVGLNLTIDGNSSNNTSVTGLKISSLSNAYSRICVSMNYCDVGVEIVGNVEKNVFFFTVNNCDIGVLETNSVVTDPDENVIFISGGENGIHYKKDTEAGRKISSIVHLAVESSSVAAVSLNDINSQSITTLCGEVRGCTGDGVRIVSGNGDAKVTFNNFQIIGLSNEHGIIADHCDYITGDVHISSFRYGIWIKKCSFGSLGVSVAAIASGLDDTDGYVVRLGDTTSTTASRFVIKEGSVLYTSRGKYSLWLDNTSFCTAGITFIDGAQTADIFYGANSVDDTVSINGREISGTIISTDSAAIRPRLSYKGLDIKTFTDSDTTPSVLGFNSFLTNTTTVTITRFDNAYSGQEITVISKGDITFDTTANANLIGSTADIVTASGDITKWICVSATTAETAIFTLVGFVDISADNSAGWQS